MRSRRRFVSSYDELMNRAYAQPNPRLLRPAESAVKLLEGYYGVEPKRKKGKCPPPCKLHVDCDDATRTLGQHRRRVNGHGASSPVASVTAPPANAAARSQLQTPVSAQPRPPARPVPNASAQPSDSPRPRVNDGSAPMRPSGVPGLRLTDDAGSAHIDGSSPAQQPVESFAPPPAGSVAPVAEPKATTASLLSRHETKGEDTTASEDDFMADMKSILTGEKVYDPRKKAIVPKNSLREHPRAEADEAAHNGVGGDANGQAIFDRIAKSMQYAGAYDLGDVELENRFADFDRMDELKDKSKKGKARRPAAPVAKRPTEASPPVDHADFIEDLDAIRKQTQEAGEAVRKESEHLADAMKPQLAAPASVPSRYTQPLYWAGEHAKAGANLYPDQLRVGKNPGVAFSYGHLIAMADLFDDVDQMMDEDNAMLAEMRKLVQEEMNGGSVSGERWEQASRKRYLRLAEDNYEHFSPNLLFPDKRFTRSLHHRNHQRAFEIHHERAIREAQKMGLDPQNANRSYVPEWPLIINAFGDHFLTDAFAAGHIVNKQEIGELFKSRFYKSPGALNSAGAAFFEKVAEAAWHGVVAAEFVKLETYESKFLWWHPDIKNAERFGIVLKKVAAAEPDKIANLAIKAVHDKFNDEGIEVVNGKGDKWQLKGDGRLTPETLRIMEAAVQESASHITDPSILASNISYPSYHARVWAYVPKLAPATQKTVRSLVDGLIKPDSAELISRAARLIHDEVSTLIDQLLAAKALRKI